MHKKVFSFFPSFFFLILYCFSSLFGECLQYENRQIETLEIYLHGRSETVKDTGTISGRLRTKRGGFFSAHDFDEDLKILAADFSKIEPTFDCENDNLSLRIDVWSKPVIAVIHWEGNSGVPICDLEKELDIKPSAVFDPLSFNAAFRKLKAYYISQGYFEAQIDYRSELDCETGELTVTITINEGRSGKIQEIRFVNFTDCEQKEILEEMITKKYNIFTSWYTQSGTYNEDAVQQDRLIIVNDLQNRGFADAQVDIAVEESCKKNRIIVTVIANKGELYRFGALAFEGNSVFDDRTIDSLFTIRRGMPFSIEDLNETIKAIVDAYGKQGYIDADVDYTTVPLEQEYGYAVKFKITEGEQFRVGLIRVFGNTVTETPVILHETLLIPGQIFNTAKLKLSELRLTNIGYFKNVNVYIVKGTESSPGDGNYRDVYIEVEETGTGQFSAFVGYSSVEQIFGGINVTERNFNHKGFSRLWSDGLYALRGGGEFTSLALQVGQKSRDYSLSWTKPYFMDTNWSIGFDLSNTCTRYISDEYDLETVSLVLRTSYDINQFVRFGFQYRLKNGYVDLHHARHNKQLREDPDIDGLISAAGPSLTYDSTDNAVNPSQGFRSRLFAEYAGIGGDHHFLSLGYLNTYYLPVGSRLVMKYRADFRFIQPLGSTRFDTIPLDERIFLGGEFMVRGFRPYRLGPHYKGNRRNRDTPKGGLSLQYYSVEAVRRITKDIEIFAFCDAGHLSEDTWEMGRMSVSIGYGTRFKLIDSLPQITLGMGYPLNAHKRSYVKKFFFSFGGNF